MSAHLEKHTRRDLRRAMGPEALDVVSQMGTGLKGLEAQMRELRITVAWQGRIIGQHQAALESYHALGRSWWSRLRWLVRGAR